MSTRPAINSLTGLRGVAALLVVVAHYASWCAPYIVSSRPDWLTYAFDTAIYGMSCFFALSGFVITYNYLDFGWDRHPGRSFFRFLFLRISRLYPALLVFILFIVMQNWSLISPVNGFPLWTVLHVFSAQAWLPATLDGQLPNASWFHVSWSISTEFMLYLFFALFAVTANHSRHLGRPFQYAIVGLVILYFFALYKMIRAQNTLLSFTSWIPTPFGPLTDAQWSDWFYFLSPYFRVVDFALGACAAGIVMKCRPFLSKYRAMFRWAANMALLGLVLLYLRPYLPNALVPQPYYGQLLAATYFAVILLNCEGKSGINRVLSSASLVFFGEISYSLYLFHPLIARFGIHWPDRLFETSLIPVLLFNMIVTGFYAVVFAYGMYRIVEMPAQRTLRRLLPLTSWLMPNRRDVSPQVFNRAP
jgi:peptidoglycan/LPS O-acetylase OafA/YrhL